MVNYNIHVSRDADTTAVGTRYSPSYLNNSPPTSRGRRQEGWSPPQGYSTPHPFYPTPPSQDPSPSQKRQGPPRGFQGERDTVEHPSSDSSSAEDSSTASNPSAGVTTTSASGGTSRSPLPPPSPHRYMTSATPGGFGNRETGIAKVGCALEGPTPNVDFVMNVNSPSFRPASASSTSGRSGGENAEGGIGGLGSSYPGIGWAAAFTSSSPHSRTAASLMTATNPVTTNNGIINPDPNAHGDVDVTVNSGWGEHRPGGLSSPFLSMKNSFAVSPAPGVSSSPSLPVHRYTSGALSNSSTATVATSSATPPDPNLLSNERIEAAIQAAITNSSSPNHPDAGNGRFSRALRSRSAASSSASGSGSGYNSERDRESGAGERSERGGDRGRDRGRISGSEVGGGERDGTGGGERGLGGDTRSVPPRDTRTLLFVGNLPYRVRWQDLKDLFRRAGTVLRADVSLGPDNRSRGYGTVLLGTAEDAGRAIDMLNGYEWQTRILEVRVDRVGSLGSMGSVGGSASGPATVSMGTMSMSGGGMGPMGAIGMSMGARGGYDPGMMNMGMGLPYGGGAGGMYSQQHQFGSSGQAFQQGSHQPQGSDPFAHEQQQHILQPTPVYQQSRYTVPQTFQSGAPASGHGSTGAGSSGVSGMNAPGRTLFVGNLPYHIQWQDLKDLFRRVPSNHPILQGKGLNATFGSGTLSLHLQNSSTLEAGYHISHSLLTFNVLRADVALGPDGRSKGFGTVVFSNVEETERARRVFSGYDFNGRQLKVHYDRVAASGATDSPQPYNLQAMPVPIPSSSPASSRGYNHQSSMLTSSSPSPTAFSLTRQMLNLSLGTNTSFIGSGSPESSAESPWSGLHQSQLIATSAPSTTNNGSSPDSSMPPNPASPNLGAAGFPRTRQLHGPTIPLGPEALRGRNSASESQKQQMIEQLQQQVHATQLSRQQSHFTSTSPPSSSTGSVRQHNPNRPTHIPLPARTFHVEVDPSLVSLENPSVITRGASSGYDGGMSGEGYEESGRGLGFGYGQDHVYPARSLEQLGLPRRRPSFVGEEQQQQTWESERQREREREQELFQLLHGSRKQQQRETQERQQGQKQGLAYSTSLSSLVAGDVRLAGTGGTTATTTTYSAPVTHSHSPTSTFARTSSSGSMSSSVSSSSSSPLTHHRHLYRHISGGKGLVFEEDAARPSSVAPLYERLDILEGGNDLGMGMVESMLAQRLRSGTSSNAPSRGARTEGEIGATPGSVSNSAAGSAAGSTRSLPLGLGTPAASGEPSARLAVRNWVEEDDEGSQHFSDVMDKGDKDRPTSSRTGSTTSESGSGLSSIRTSQSGSSGSALSFAASSGSYPYSKRVRGMAQSGRGAASCTGSDADISEADGEGEGGLDDEDVPPVPVPSSKSSELPKSPNQSRLARGGSRRGRIAEKTATDRQHPGPIALPPPPPVVPISITPQVARGSSATVHSFSSLLADGLFHQHHPFASGDQDEGHDYAQFDYSGIPTVQPPASQSIEREGKIIKSNIEQDHAQERQRPDQQNQPWSSGTEPPKQQQAQVYPLQIVFPLTPHGLPPITPSMPPFSLITGATGSLSHYQARQQRVSRQQASNNRRYGSNPPGTLSLPSQYQQGQQQPLRTPPAYVHPLGSPGSPYALGPHHPLHHQYHHHHHQHYHSHSFGQYPLAQPFAEGVSPGVSQQPPHLMSPVHPSPLGHPAAMHQQPHSPQHMYPMVNPGHPSGSGLGAMSPGTFWGRPGEMTGNPYMNHAVGAPVSIGASGGTAPEHSGRPLDTQEPKGYFDQLYMTPSSYPASKGLEEEAAIGATRRTSTDSNDSTGEWGIQKEIMKDKDQGGVVKAVKQAGSEQPKASSHVEMQDTSIDPSPAAGIGKRGE